MSDTGQLIPFPDSELDQFCHILGNSGLCKVKNKEEIQAKALWSYAMGVDPIIGIQQIDMIQGNPSPSGSLIASRLHASENYFMYIIMQTTRKCVIGFYMGSGLSKAGTGPYAGNSIVPEMAFLEWFDKRKASMSKEERDKADHRLEEGNLTFREMVMLKGSLSQGLREGVCFSGVKEWTLGMAKEAGLLGKGSWKSHADSMLLWRCVSNGQKAYSSDLWQGGKVYTSEELGEEPKPEDLQTEIHHVTVAEAATYVDAEYEVAAPEEMTQEEADADHNAPDKELSEPVMVAEQEMLF